MESANLLGGCAPYSVQPLSLPPARPAGKILEGEPENVVAEVVKALKEEDKVL